MGKVIDMTLHLKAKADADHDLKNKVWGDAYIEALNFGFDRSQAMTIADTTLRITFKERED